MTRHLYHVSDDLRLDLSSLQPDGVRQFKDELLAGAPSEDPARLIVTVAATHAGLITRNRAFYRPDVMRRDLQNFMEPNPKPVQLHHNDHSDPVGRVARATYIDTSAAHIDALRTFRSRYGASNFVDAKTDTGKAIDQYKWVAKNLAGDPNFRGLGFGELDLSITDKAAGEKILDQRYLNVSVGFTADHVFCSHCGHDWAEEGGPCEHSPGDVIDGIVVSLIPGKMVFDEVSWVNTPADPFARVTRIVNALYGHDATKVTDSAKQNTSVTQVVPILFGAGGGRIYRLDISDSAAEGTQEVIEVQPHKKADAVETATVSCVEWPKAAFALLVADSTSRQNYVAGEAGETPHKHRCIVDPATGNGWTDFALGHSHEVVNLKVQPATRGRKNESDEWEEFDEHAHPLGEKIEKISSWDELDRTVNKKISDEADAKGLCPKCKKPKAECVCAVANSTTNASGLNEGLADEAKTEAEAEKTEDAKLCPKCKKPLSECVCDDKGKETDETADEAEDVHALVDAVQDAAGLAKVKDLLKAYDGADKNKLRAKVARLARRFGDAKPAEPRVVQFEFAGEKLAVADAASLVKAVRAADDYKRLGSDKAVRDSVLEVAKVVGMTDADAAKLFTDEEIYPVVGEPTSVESAVKSAEDTAKKVCDETTVAEIVEALAGLDEDRRKELVQKLLDTLVEKGLMADPDGEVADLSDEVESLKDQVATLGRANRDIYVGRQKLMADMIVNFKKLAKVEGFAEMSDEDAAAHAEVLQLRSIDRLSEQLNKIVADFVADAARPAIEKTEDEQPGSTIEEVGQKPQPIDVRMFEGMSELDYETARHFRDKYRGK
jgi:hypothetical protein